MSISVLVKVCLRLYRLLSIYSFVSAPIYIFLLKNNLEIISKIKDIMKTNLSILKFKGTNLRKIGAIVKIHIHIKYLSAKL